MTTTRFLGSDSRFGAEAEMNGRVLLGVGVEEGLALVGRFGEDLRSGFSGDGRRREEDWRACMLVRGGRWWWYR